MKEPSCQHNVPLACFCEYCAYKVGDIICDEHGWRVITAIEYAWAWTMYMDGEEKCEKLSSLGPVTGNIND